MSTLGGKSKVIVNEVGLRDGLQNQTVYVPTTGKLELAQALVSAGVRDMEVTSFVSPKHVPQMADAGELFSKLPLPDQVDYTVLIPNAKGYERALEAGARSVTIVLSATETMNQKNIGMSLRETRTVARSLIKRAAGEGVTTRCYVSVAFECPFEGRVDEDHVDNLVGELFDCGAAEVIVADTVGAANPAHCHSLFTRLCQHYDSGRLSAHMHDTRALALANIWAALCAGIRRFDSSIGGLGGCPFTPGAAGNVATEDLVLMLHQCGFETGIDAKKLLPAIDVAARLTERQLGGRSMTWFRRSVEKSEHRNGAGRVA